MATNDPERPDEGPWKVQLDAEGNLHGFTAPRDEKPLELARPAPPPPEAPLELNLPPPPPPPIEPPKISQRGPLALVLGAAALLALAGIALLFHRPAETRAAAANSSQPAPSSSAAPVASAPVEDENGPVTLTIESEPAGATVILGGEESGRTPFLGSIPRANHPLRVELHLEGYKNWSTNLDAAHLQAGRPIVMRALLRK